MKFAPVLPYQYDPASLTTYHLVLAHELAADQNALTYYKKLRGHTIILDNGVIELGQSVSFELLESIWKQLPNSYVVIPDKVGNAMETILLARQFMKRQRNRYRACIIPQGSDPNIWINCLRTLLGIVPQHFKEVLIGIPRVTQDFPGGREGLFHRAMADWDGPFHLFGIQHNIDEVQWARNYPRIWGVDSSLPIRAAASRIHVPDVKDLRKLPDYTEFRPDLLESVRQEITTASIMVG